MDAISLLRDYVQDARGFFEGTIQDVTPEQAHWSPPGQANPLGANVAHVVFSEDMAINGLLQGKAPLAATNWAGKTGVSDPPPDGAASPAWGEWARKVKVDLPALRQYAQAVHAATDEYLASLSDEALRRPLDLSAMGLGQQTVSWMLNAVLISNVHLHCGEISCLKGLQGAKGYPF